MLERVVVSSLGILCPVGIGIEAFWKALLAGQSGVGPLTLFDTTGFPTRIAAEVPNFEPKKYVKQRKALKVMARDIQLAAAAAQLAVDSVDLDALVPERFGISLGAGLITAEHDELGPSLYRSRDEDGSFNLVTFGSEGIKNLFPLWLLKYLPNMLGSQVSIFHNAQGPNNAITTGPVASSQAIGEAVRVIERGAADCFLCGGAESKITPLNLLRYHLLGQLSRRNGEPERASRPFDMERDGLVIGEGAAVLFIERLEHAVSRGVEPIAEIVGYGTATGATHPSAGNMNPDGVVNAMERAIKDAGMSPEDISFVISSASGMPREDAVECHGIREALGEAADHIPVTSIRSMVGHLDAGSGALDICAACLAAQHGLLPATINYETADPDCNLKIVTGPPAQVGPVGLVVTVGLGSQATCLIVKRVEV